MLQLVYKKSCISAAGWSVAYNKIVEIVHAFPLQLLRLKSYDGFSRELDKLYVDLYVDKDPPNERISFYTDWISFTGGKTVFFIRIDPKPYLHTNWRSNRTSAGYIGKYE